MTSEEEQRSACKEARREQARTLKSALRDVRQLYLARDLPGLLAVSAGLPEWLRERPELLIERAKALWKLQQFQSAHELYHKALTLDRTRTDAWLGAGLLLRKLRRQHEVPAFIDEMLAALPHAAETLVRAAGIARKAEFYALAGRLIDEALSPPLQASAAAVVEAARLLLELGQEGRVVTVLKGHPCFAEQSWQTEADALTQRALARLRFARGANASAPVSETDQAHVIAVETILARSGRAREKFSPMSGGIAIVLGSLGPGGAEIQAVHFMRELCSARWRPAGPIVILLTSPPSLHSDFNTDKLAGLDVTIECVSDFDVDLKDVVPDDIAEPLGVLLPRTGSKTAFLVDRLRAHRPEVVLVMSFRYDLEPTLAASIVGVPRIIVSARGDVPVAGSARDQFYKGPYQAVLAGKGIALSTNSQATARALSEWLGIPPSDIVAIHNGVDVEGLRSRRHPATRAAYRDLLKIPQGVRIVGSVFNAKEAKRPKLWIQAASIIAAQVPDVVFVVVGKGFGAGEAAASLIPPELAERFHRPGVQKDVPNWLDMMEVVLLTSITEGTPNALLEAQALGKPVVATAVGGVAETFLPGETGILLSAHPTPEEVADAVMQVLNDPAYALRAREQGPAFLRRRFGIERMAAELVDLCFPGRQTNSLSA